MPKANSSTSVTSQPSTLKEKVKAIGSTAIGSLFSRIGSIVKTVSSFLIGIPTALAATVVVGTTFLFFETLNILNSHAIKNNINIKILKFAPALNAASNFLKGSLVKIWTGWGIYPYLQIGQALSDGLNDFCNFFEAEGHRDRIEESKHEKKMSKTQKITAGVALQAANAAFSPTGYFDAIKAVTMFDDDQKKPKAKDKNIGKPKTPDRPEFHQKPEANIDNAEKNNATEAFQKKVVSSPKGDAAADMIGGLDPKNVYIPVPKPQNPTGKPAGSAGRGPAAPAA